MPIVLDFVKPKSIVDIGCATGAWLSTFIEHGITDVAGVDGEWVQDVDSMIPEDNLMIRDLEEPLKLDREFDLAITLEVAEHLSMARAGGFVDDLTSLSDIVLFSAAIPGQGGAHHVNEQWPQYWAELFATKGYVLVDAMRPALWQRPDVDEWYPQNMFFFVSESVLGQHQALSAAKANTRMDQIDLVHPRVFEKKVARLNRGPRYYGAKRMVSDFPGAIRDAFRRRVR